MKEVIIALIAGIFGFVPAYFVHVRKLRELDGDKIKLAKENIEGDLRLDFYSKLAKISSYNLLSRSVDFIFNATVADQFLIITAINGKEDFNIISVMFEQHEKDEIAINAVATYKNLKIDLGYKLVLKNAERDGSVILTASKMEEGDLKDFFELEGIRFCELRHLLRISLDDSNDMLVFSTLSTHGTVEFTRLELAYIKTQYEGSIIPNLIEAIKK